MARASAKSRRPALSAKRAPSPPEVQESQFSNNSVAKFTSVLDASVLYSAALSDLVRLFPTCASVDGSKKDT